MAVKAGAYDDPEDLPGLAHFCEHMLFLGTKKYPDQTGFEAFLSRAGGSSNAETSSQMTVFYSSFTSSAAKEALDRFTDFFVEPSFNENFTKQEVHAIDNEHAKNLRSPGRLMAEVINFLANPASPVHHFPTGNFDTLYKIPKEKGIDPVKALKVYFRQRYCPSQMRLVTIGPDALAKQLKSAIEHVGKLDAGDPSCQNASWSRFTLPEPYTPDLLSKYVVMGKSDPQPNLCMFFPLPILEQDTPSQPFAYLDYLFTYAGEKSLQQVLKEDLQLITDTITVSTEKTAAVTKYYVCFDLTKHGSQNIDKVLHVFFSYIADIRAAGVNKALYKSLADIRKLNFDWLQPAAPMIAAKTMAERMTRLDPARLVSGDNLIASPDPALVTSLLERMTPENVIAVHFPSADDKQKFPAGAKVQPLPHYETSFSEQSLEEIAPELKSKWKSWLKVPPASSNETSQPQAPRPITGIPKDIATDFMKVGHSKVSGTTQDTNLGKVASINLQLYGPAPHLLSFEPATSSSEEAVPVLQPHDSKVWYRQGWMTTSPTVQMKLIFQPLRSKDEAEASALDQVHLIMYIRLLALEIVPKLADLQQTGANFELTATKDSLDIGVNGYAEVLPALINKLMEEFNRFNLEGPERQERLQQRFNSTVEEMRLALTSYPKLPAVYAVQDRTSLLKKGDISNEELLAALKQVTLESSLKSLGQLLLSRPLETSSLTMGNCGRDEALKLVKQVSSSIKLPSWITAQKAQQGDEVQHVTPVVDPAGPIEVRKLNPKGGDPDDVAVVSIIDGVATIERRVVYGILGGILQNLIYSNLRTRQQLGYVVNAGATMISNVYAVSAVVQGISKGADYFEAAIEGAFYDTVPKYLKTMTEDEFQHHKRAYLQELLQPPQTALEEVNHVLGSVSKGGVCFDLIDEMFNFANSSKVSRELLVRTWSRLMEPDSGIRKKVSVKYFAKKVPPRPSASQWLKLLDEGGVPKASQDTLIKEFEQASLFEKVDSAAQNKIVAASAGRGYFPRDLNCRAGEASKTST
eukprot:TRINITY_DN33382_c0_g1_i1.p1 TRINITY_DN33382_c0_g1~~TRINITY_DN33382_c0_g1_i1.p1  ORF type:complete len:1156 (-),score=258.79 TRINITY_DN33382_c0_g1_i1:389-3481(-)